MKQRIPVAVALVVLAGCAPTPPPSPPQPASAAGAAGAPPPEYPRTPPPLGPAPTLTLPTPERRVLPNGLEVMFVRHGSLPVVHATLVTRGGTTADPARLPGLASFVAEMLDEGAGGKSALELSSALDLLGAELRTGAGADAAYVDLHVLRDRLPQALQLMADVAARPDFPEPEVHRIREQRITDLTRGRDEPRVIAGNAFSALVYGSEHPYGRLPGVETTRRIDRAELARFHQQFYRPDGSTLILVGDVDPQALAPAVEQAFGAWQGSAAPLPSIPGATAPARTTLYLIDKPEAAQSEIRIGHPGVARDNPDFFPLVVLNTILGGSFTSRLNTNLREQHGFAYGAGSSFSMRLGAGPFTASSAVFSAKTDSAVVEFFRELRRIREEAVPEAELQRARNYVALGLPRRFETTQDVASQLADLTVYGLSMDLYNQYVRRVMEVTAEDVQRVARRYLHPDRAVVVIVGDVKSIEPGLRQLELGPVELRKTEEFVR